MRNQHFAGKASLRHKTVVITGASSGVGRAAALLFASEGAHVVIAARRATALTILAEEITSLGGTALAVPTDVTDAAAHQDLASAAASFGHGVIDVWINNAGVLAVGALDDMPPEVITRVIQTNLLGYIYGAQAVLPYFRNQGHGVLINNISVGGWMPVPYGVAYSASKTGLWGFNGALEAELSAWPHIHICGLYPAVLDTPGLQHAANYTGKVLTNMPPVFDPMRVAKAMVATARAPRRAVWTDPAAPFMRMSYALLPRLTGGIGEWIMRRYFNRAADEPPSDGNLFDGRTPLTSIHGGWRTPPGAKTIRKRVALTGGIIGLMLLLGTALSAAREK